MSKYQLGNQSFNTWKDVIAHAQSILHKGTRVLVGDELQFAKDLLGFHPRKQKKTQNGVSAIKVDRTPFFTYKNLHCFVLVDNKGNEDAFSYNKCSPRTIDRREKVVKSIDNKTRLKCYRESIFYQTQKAKKILLKESSVCACCGSDNDLQVDHKTKSFISIVNEFEAFYKPNRYPTVQKFDKGYVVCEFKKTRKVFTAFIEAWQLYHDSHADYQILCGSCNFKKQDGVRYRPYIKKELSNELKSA